MADGVNDKDRVLADFAPGEERAVAREGSPKSPRPASPHCAGWRQRSVFRTASADHQFAPLTPWIPATTVDVVVTKGARTRRAAADPIITFDFETSNTPFPPRGI